mmetsp:Transcript_41702/g.98977  ORF Transcript_41702/g.98977 Transcript_41702/m.98977 type:complete len:201 (-) Transcript_41702:715-1317(-)
MQRWTASIDSPVLLHGRSFASADVPLLIVGVMRVVRCTLAFPRLPLGSLLPGSFSALDDVRVSAHFADSLSSVAVLAMRRERTRSRSSPAVIGLSSSSSSTQACADNDPRAEPKEDAAREEAPREEPWFCSPALGRRCAAPMVGVGNRSISELGVWCNCPPVPIGTRFNAPPAPVGRCIISECWFDENDICVMNGVLFSE